MKPFNFAHLSKVCSKTRLAPAAPAQLEMFQLWESVRKVRTFQISKQAFAATVDGTCRPPDLSCPHQTCARQLSDPTLAKVTIDYFLLLSATFGTDA